VGKRLRTTAVLLVAGSTLALAACGSDDESGSDSTTASTAGTSAPGTAAPDTTSAGTEAPDTTSAGTEAPDTTSADTEAADTTTADTDAPETTSAPAGLACADTEGKVVGYSEPLPDPNFALIEDVIRLELDKAGMTLEPVNANLDPAKQIADVNTLLEAEIDVLLINPVDPNAVQGVLEDVRGAGIPIVVQDTKVGGPYLTNVTADVEAAAAAGAQLLKDTVGDGEVAAISGPPFAEVLVREAEAFAAAAEAVGLNLVETQTNMTITPDTARDLTQTFKQQYPDLAGLWTFNDTSAVGAAAAFDDSFKPVLVSINGQPEAIPLVKDGTILATYDLQQDMLGRALAYAAIAAVCGTELPEDIWVESLLIDSSNVDEWVNPAERGKEEVALALEERDGKTYLVVVEG